LVIDKINEQNYPGNSNTIYGEGAGNRSQNAYLNTFIGKSTGRAITIGNINTIIGNAAGTKLTTGNNNIFVGRFAGASNTTGSENIILGTVSCTNCDKNIFMGWGGTSFLPLDRNVLIGSFRDKKVGFMSNTFIGNEAGGNADSVSFGTFIGISAGQNARASGIMIGNMAGQGNRFFVNFGESLTLTRDYHSLSE
jgi:trimeric autotransporter adhesin